jgi:hypothetical protein
VVIHQCQYVQYLAYRFDTQGHCTITIGTLCSRLLAMACMYELEEGVKQHMPVKALGIHPW